MVGKWQLLDIVTSTITLTVTSIQLYFLARDDKKRPSLSERLDRTVKLTPFYLPAILFRVLCVSLSLSLFKEVGIVLLLFWCIIYTHMIGSVTSGNPRIKADLFIYGPLNCITIYPDSPPAAKRYRTMRYAPPFPFKAVMRLGAWVNFGFNTLWVLLLSTAIWYFDGSEELRIGNLDPNSHIWLKENFALLTMGIIMPLGLASCVLVELYLTCAPELLCLSRDHNYADYESGDWELPWKDQHDTIALSLAERGLLAATRASGP